MPVSNVTTGGKADAVYPVTWDDVKTHLVGLGEWRSAARADGYDDTRIETKVIPASIREFERRLMMHILPVRYVPQNMNTGNTFIADSPYNYLPFPLSTLRLDQVQGHYFMMELPTKPILAIHRMKIMINPNQAAFEIPLEWIVFEPETGIVNIQPASPTPQVVALSVGSFALQIMSQDREYIPRCVEFVADMGLPQGWESGLYYADLHRALSQYTAKKVLDDINQVFDPGRASVGGNAFGASTSINYERFTQLRGELERMTDAWISEYRQNNVGISVGGI